MSNLKRVAGIQFLYKPNECKLVTANQSVRCRLGWIKVNPYVTVAFIRKHAICDFM